jgi:tetratricopeptide (TPR) repeat protein
MDKAFELQTRLVSGSSEFYGEDHGLTLKRKADLGLIYIQKDQLEQGITLLEEALADPSRHKSLPSYSPSLAFAYARAGKRDEAIRLIGQSIAQARVNLPEKSADLARKLVAGARVLNEVQDWETAQTYLREASDVILVELPDQVELGNVKAALGTTLLGLAEKLGEEDERRQALLVEAETCLTEGVAILKEKSASMPANVREPRIVETLEALVRLYTIWNLPDKAKPWRVELDARQVN